LPLLVLWCEFIPGSERGYIGYPQEAGFWNSIGHGFSGPNSTVPSPWIHLEANDTAETVWNNELDHDTVSLMARQQPPTRHDSYETANNDEDD